MAPKNTLELRNGPKSDDMKITLRVNGRLDHPQADGGSIEGLNVADETATIGFRGTITEFTVHRGEGSADITDASGTTESIRFKNLEGYDTRDGLGGGGSGSSDSGTGGDSSGGSGTSADASGSWTPSTDSDRDLTPRHGIVDRPYQSTSDRTITVGKGGDVGTVQAALNALPRFVEHKVTIQLERGVHSNEPGDSLNCAPTIAAAAHGDITIKGDADNPRDYAIDVRQGNMMFLSGTAQNTSFEGVHFRGSLQNRFGALELDNCVVSAGARWNKGDPVALDTYGGVIQCIDTRLESDKVAMNFVEDATITMNAGCTVDAGGPLCSSGQGGGTLSMSGDADLSCNGTITSGWEPGLVVVRDSHGATDGLDTGEHAVVHSGGGWL